MAQRRPPRSLGLAIDAFQALKDPRIDRTKRHSLLNVLVMALCGCICGTEGWDELAMFARGRKDWFAGFLDMPGGVPSADTFRRVFERLAPAGFEECFGRWVAALATDFAGEVVAIDGKTLRGLVERAGEKSQLHLVHVWATQQQLLLRQQAVEGAPGEMGAIPELLRVLDLEGAVITTDANSCTAPVTRAIVESKADYVLAVKGNRGHFYEHVVSAFARKKQFAGNTHGEVGEGHGRKETRVVSVLELEEWPETTKKNGDWAGLRTAVRVERTREMLDGTTSGETHYFVSSLPPDAKRIAKAVRAHWSIENNLHWVLDVAFGDDRRKTRDARAAENLAVIARMALTLVKHEPTRTMGVAASRKRAGWEPDYLARVLTSGKSIT